MTFPPTRLVDGVVGAEDAQLLPYAILEVLLLGINLCYHKTMKQLLQTCQEQENMGKIIDVRESELGTPGPSARDNESSTNAIIGRPTRASSQK